MSSETYPPPQPHVTIQDQARVSGLRVWNGKPVEHLTDQECRDYFHTMARRGVYYLCTEPR